MKYKFFFGISVFNVFLIIFVISYIVALKLTIFDTTVMEFFRYTIIGLAIALPIVWSFLVYTVDCPYCGDKALPFIMERPKQSNKEQVIPVLLRPFTLMVDKEYFVGYCHCMVCQKKIIFKKSYVETCDEV